MPIEFPCKQCGATLRTPDDSSGKLGRCPQCGAYSEVPAAGAAAELAPPVKPAADAANPYAYSGGLAAEAKPTEAGLPRGQVDLAAVFQDAWQVFKDQLGACILGGLWVAVLVAMAVAVSLAVGGALVFGLFGAGGGARPSPGMMNLISSVFGIVLGVALAVPSAYFQGGTLNYFLHLSRGEEAPFGLMFSGGRWLGRLAGLNALQQLAFGLLQLLCAIPYAITDHPLLNLAGNGVSLVAQIAVIAFLLFWPLFVVERDLSLAGAFHASIQHLEGNRLMAVVVMILASVGGTAAVCCTLGVGLLFYIPFAMLLVWIMYFAATGRSNAGAQARQAAGA